MAKKRKTWTPFKIIPNSNLAPQLPSSSCYEGNQLDDLLTKPGSNNLRLGVNDVTRVLERMPARERDHHSAEDGIKSPLPRAALVPLQSILLASDCNPPSLTKHIPSLAASRNVPVIFVKDDRRGFMRLGELVKLKTAMAIGVKTEEAISTGELH